MDCSDARYLQPPEARKMTTDEREALPMATTSMVRLPLFDAQLGVARKMKQSEKLVFENKTGRLVISVLAPTLSHFKVLAAAIAHAVDAYEQGGALAFVFRPADVLHALGHAHTGNRAWLEARIEELRQTRVDFVATGDRGKVTGGIVRKYRASRDPMAGEMTRKLVPTRDAASGQVTGYAQVEEPEVLWSLTLESEFCRFFELETGLKFGRLLGQINELRHPVVQAVALYALSHRELNMELDQVLKELHVLEPSAGKGDAAWYRNYRSRRAVVERKGDLAAMGIELRNTQSGRLGVFHRGVAGVQFVVPKVATSPGPRRGATKAANRP